MLRAYFSTLFLLSMCGMVWVFLKHYSVCVSKGQHQEDGQQRGFEWILLR